MQVVSPVHIRGPQEPERCQDFGERMEVQGQADSSRSVTEPRPSTGWKTCDTPRAFPRVTIALPTNSLLSAPEAGLSCDEGWAVRRPSPLML